VLAARIMNRLAAQPSAHLYRTQQLFGLASRDWGDAHDDIALAALARDHGIAIDAPVVVIGFQAPQGRHRIADAIALSASAFQPDAQIAPNGARTYVMFRETSDSARGATSWVRGTVAMLQNELSVEVRAVIATSVAGLPAVAAARVEIDQAMDSALRHPASINPVTTLAEARTTVLLDEIVAVLRNNDRLVDPRIRQLRDREPVLCATLQSYLDCFGDIANAAAELQVHPNTVRYRIRRLEQLLAASLRDPDVRLVLTLSLRATV
jgi:DNA-binding PucR family transcriptional regulator